MFSLTSYQDTRLTAESEIFQSQPGDDLWRTWRLTNSCQRSLGGETAQHQLQLPNLAWLAEMDLVNLRLAGPAVLRLSPTLLVTPGGPTGAGQSGINCDCDQSDPLIISHSHAGSSRSELSSVSSDIEQRKTDGQTWLNQITLRTLLSVLIKIQSSVHCLTS